MKKPIYDFDKETDRDFLREAGKMLQEKVIVLEMEVLQLKLQKEIDEAIRVRLTGELLVLRRRVFDSKQEKKKKLKDLKKKKRKHKINLLHNQNENKSELEENTNQEIQLSSQEIEYNHEDQCPHCECEDLSEMRGLFEESTEYDVENTYYLLKRHKRKKYKCKSCKKIVTAKGGVKLTSGGMFSVQMANQVICDKFEHHIPLERQRKKMQNAGLKVSVKTLFSLTDHVYNVLFELHEMNRQDILRGHYICLDESPMPFYNPEKSSGYVWSLSNNIGVYYQFEPTRSQEVAKELVRGFSGIVVTDGYSGYGFLKEEKGMIHAYCWSHLRRYFFDAMRENDDAGTIVDYIDNLYEIEHMATSYEDLKHLRKSRSSQIYQDIELWIEENEGSYLSSTLTGKAITYFYNQKLGLTKFLSNERVPLDNNMAERRQRCPVMGRKNYLAFRSINGADAGMFFYSIIETCKTNGLNPSSYLNEMAIRKLRGEKIETPYQYASGLKTKIINNLAGQLKEVSVMVS